jgi:hypothetical protein
MWCKATSSTGREYYFNSVTGETSWELNKTMAMGPPPPPPLQTEQQELEDFAKCCGWNGLCILKDYETKKRWGANNYNSEWNGGRSPHRGETWVNDDRVARFQQEWSNTWRPPGGKFAEFELGSPICCKVIYKYKCEWSGCELSGTKSPLCIKGKNTEDKDYFPEHFYPCPSCDPEYWKRAKKLRLLPKKMIDEANSVLGLVPVIPRESKPFNPSPGNVCRMVPGTNAACTILYDMVIKQQKIIDEMSHKISALESRSSAPRLPPRPPLPPQTQPSSAIHPPPHRAPPPPYTE